MKKFKAQIQVTIEVDRIAEHLLSTINPELAHKEMIVESIIGSLVHEGKLHYLYNALHGYSNDINFKVGDMVNVTETYYHDDSRQPIGQSQIVDIDIYRDNKLLVKYHDLKGREQLKWVYHHNAGYLAIVPCTDVEAVSEPIVSVD